MFASNESQSSKAETREQKNALENQGPGSSIPVSDVQDVQALSLMETIRQNNQNILTIVVK